MKLRNKKTGEIDDYIFEVITDRIDLYRRVGHSDTKNIWRYNSLADFNSEWEDYEVPEGWWFIDRTYEPHATNSTLRNRIADEQIGNYFGTREEAEKAVEKLKAWKRLKDKKFKFHEWYRPDGCEPFIVIETNIDDDDVDNMGLQKDLDLLFCDIID